VCPVHREYVIHLCPAGNLNEKRHKPGKNYIQSPTVLSRAKIVKATSNSTSDKAGLGWKIWVKKFLTFRLPHLCHLDLTAQSGGENISFNL